MTICVQVHDAFQFTECAMSDELPAFQILSLDGGGIRGLFTAAVLAAAEEDLKTRITDHFDLVAGTSAGGIIAVGLGLGLRARDLVGFFVQHTPTIFHSRFGLRALKHWISAKYPADSLQS